MRPNLCTALIIAATASSAHAQEPAATADTLIRSSVREVVLDVIVRHKDMSLDDKLKASDFAITEDGVPQTVKTFRFVGGREARRLPQQGSSASGAAATANPPATPLHEPNFVSIVLGEMGPDSRRNAIEAATDFLDQEFQGATYAAVFSLGLRLNVIHEFTNNRTALARAVRTAVSGTSMELAAASTGVLNQTTYTTTGGPGGVSINPAGDPTRTSDMATSGASQSPLSEAQQALASMIDAQRDMVSNIAGMELMNGLLRLVEYESKLPGRKTVLYLSEGLIKPPNRQDAIRRVIGAANRGNVSFYCLDVRGLKPGTSNGLSSGLLTAAAGISGSQGTMSSSPSAAMRQADEFDLIAQSLSSHIQLNMAELAEGTGGFALFNTQDFKKGMARVMEDVRTHYEISYVPASTLYDGRFRQVKVSVRDAKLLVQSRDGYFALPDLNGVSVQPFEMEGLRVLQGNKKQDFDFHVAALRFQPLALGFRYEMVFDVDTSQLTARVDPKTHLARIHGTFLALIKEPFGNTVSKVSQEIDREVPEDKLSQFREGKIIVTSPFEMAPGRYTIEAAATDPEGNRASSKRISLVVPRSDGVALSSVAVARKIDPLTSPRNPGDPLEFAGGKVVPALAQKGGGEADTVLFFVVYPKPDAAKPKISVTFSRDGLEVARNQPDPGKADGTNPIPILTAAKLPPGEYLAQVSVEQAGTISKETIAMRVDKPLKQP